MNLINQIFGTDIYKDIKSGIDSLILTDQEKLDYHLKFLDAYHPFKVTQRLISLLILIPYSISFLLSQIIYILGLILNSHRFLTGSEHLIQVANQTYATILTILVSFYFTGGVVNTFINAKKRS